SRRAEPRRRAAAEVECRELPALRPFIRESDLELPSDSGHVLVHGHVATNRDREIAVHAASRAERDVDVQMSRKHLEICPVQRRRAPPVSAHSTAPRSSNPVTAERHWATGSPALAHNSSSVAAPWASALHTRSSTSSSERGSDRASGDRPARLSASAIE